MSPPRHSAEFIENVDRIQGDSASRNTVIQAEVSVKLGQANRNGEGESDAARPTSEVIAPNTEERKLQEESVIADSMAHTGPVEESADPFKVPDESEEDKNTTLPSVCGENALSELDPMSSSTATLKPEPESKQA